MTYGDTAAIEAVRADLDGDAVPELVIAVLTGVSNGLAVPSWEVTVVDGRYRHPPQRVSAVEYNSAGSWVRIRGVRGCLFLHTYWQELDLDPRRPRGLYLTGSLWPFIDGRFADTLLPRARARRLLISFSNTRATDSYHPSQSWPLLWLLDQRAGNIRSPVRTPMNPDTTTVVPR